MIAPPDLAHLHVGRPDIDLKVAAKFYSLPLSKNKMNKRKDQHIP